MNLADAVCEIEKIQERLFNLRLNIERIIEENFFKEKKLREINDLNRNIASLPLSTLTINILKHNGIYTLDELKYWKRSDIKKLKMDDITMKESSTKDLLLILKCFGLSFKRGN